MAEGYLALDLLHLMHQETRYLRRAERREWRETRDPFDLHPEEFLNLFRLNMDAADYLIEELESGLSRQKAYGLSAETQVLTALRFYATGCYQQSVGEHWDLCVSQPSVSRCIRKVTDLINEKLLRRWIKFPSTPAEIRDAVTKFENAAQPFQNTIGAVDCTYVHIIAPKTHEQAYVNHWGNHSLNVQCICDPNLKILNVNARYPGARHDNFIWKNSAARRIMVKNFECGLRNTWIIGDEGYMLEPWLMTPLNNEPPGTPQYKYTEELCSARSVVERLFGMLKAEFRCLSCQRKLLYDPIMSGKIFNACAVLHNIRVHHSLNDIPIDQHEIEEHIRTSILQIEDMCHQEKRTLAQRIQAGFIAKTYG